MEKLYKKLINEFTYLGNRNPEKKIRTYILTAYDSQRRIITFRKHGYNFSDVIFSVLDSFDFNRFDYVFLNAEDADTGAVTRFPTQEALCQK